MKSLTVEPFGDKCSAKFPAVVAGPTGDIIAYFHDKRHAALVARAVNAQAQLLEALGMAAGWIDTHSESPDTGEGQQARWILETIESAAIAAGAKIK